MKYGKLLAVLLVSIPLYMSAKETVASKATIKIESGKTAEVKSSFDPCVDVNGYSIKITPKQDTQEFDIEVILSH